MQRVIRLSGKSGRSPPPGSSSASSIDKRSCGTPNSVSAGTVRRHCRPLLSRMRASVLPSLLEPLPSLGPPLCSSRPLLHKTNGVGAGGSAFDLHNQPESREMHSSLALFPTLRPFANQQYFEESYCFL